jgi:hypothetical protein
VGEDPVTATLYVVISDDGYSHHAVHAAFTEQADAEAHAQKIKDGSVEEVRLYEAADDPPRLLPMFHVGWEMDPETGAVVREYDVAASRSRAVRSGQWEYFDRGPRIAGSEPRRHLHGWGTDREALVRALDERRVAALAED